VLAGNVNVGKSCLFNALLGKKRALVHETPGTTRDWLESSLEIDGIPITLIDTAGFRDTTSEIERSGIAETNRLVASADIVIYLHDTLSSIPERSLIREKEHTVLHVLSKSDLLGELTVPERVIAVSSINGTGLAILRNTIAGCARDMIRAGATSPAVLVARHARELNGALEHIRTALDGIETLTEDILSCEVRAATNHLEAILGKSIGIDVLDEIFSHFCIGK
jgi:tRNA modification GTPase